MPGVTTAYQAGVHGSRPAASAGCILYSCSTHGLVYRSDGTNWTTWLTLPSGVASAAPALTFGTSAAAGAASTYVATDATLPIFDATAPTTQAFGDAAAVGAAGVAARRDHKHAMPASEAPAGWTGWTPALTATSVNPTLGSGSVTDGRYNQWGKRVLGNGRVIFGSSGAAAGTGEYRLSLPVNAQPTDGPAGHGFFYDSSAVKIYLVVAMFVSQTLVRLLLDQFFALSATTPVVPAANDQVQINYQYEAA